MKQPCAQPAPAPSEAWWSVAPESLLSALGSTLRGLTSADAAQRLTRYGPNRMGEEDRLSIARLLWRQVSNPLVLILFIASSLSLLLRDWVDAATVLAILLLSALVGFWQEVRAGQAVAQLRRRLALTARARRDGGTVMLPTHMLVPGDVIELAAGSLVPADGRVLEARDFLVNEASLTGESFPVEKRAGVVAAETPLAGRTNAVHLGSSVRSGTATVLLVATGRATRLAEVAERIGTADEETAFERGVRRFGELLLRVMLVMVVVVLVANQWLGRPLVDSLLFAMALAVGLTPELLPAIVSVSLARGARRLAAGGVLVRRLDAIEDLGSLDVLCTDKTGTLTLGTMALDRAVDTQGRPSDAVLRLAYLNAALETGIDNPIDAALVSAGERAGLSTRGHDKVDEVPYDFLRRRLTIVVRPNDAPHRHRLITNGAVTQVLAVCALDDAARAQAEAFAREHGQRGVRVLALATRDLDAQPRYGTEDERDMEFRGLLCFHDPAKPDAAAALHALMRRGVKVKMVTGDSRHVAAHLAAQVGLDAQALLTGEQIAGLRDEALWHLAPRTSCFAEIDPMQKERIVRALQHTGHAVGFLGDGINDAPALHASDVGISVDHAADVARESADIVLLQPDLSVLERGIAEGRRTFANTLKYIQITTSANFGNMVSMALATPLLPFLPLTATQILLNNFLSDLPSMALSADRVEPAQLRHAQRWDLAQLRRFMIIFGLVSSVFDLLTFALLVRMFEADAPLFHSAWFMVSLLTELAVVMVLRSRGLAWRSRPARLLALTTVAAALLAMALPYLPPAARLFGFVPLPAPLLLATLAIVLAYVAVTEATKLWFWRTVRKRR